MHGVGPPDRHSSGREQVHAPASLEDAAVGSGLVDIAASADMAHRVAEDVKLDACGEERAPLAFPRRASAVSLQTDGRQT